jgi:hypothetical protein
MERVNPGTDAQPDATAASSSAPVRLKAEGEGKEKEEEEEEVEVLIGAPFFLEYGQRKLFLL